MNRRAMIHRLLSLSALLLAPLALVACGSAEPSADVAAHPPLEGAAIGGPFTLVDQNGKLVTWDTFNGKYRIVYFGYTFCPDACPVDMQKIMKGFATFAEANPDRAAKVQPIFITVDPARDTPAVLKQWTGAFSPRLIGLTGTPEQVGLAAKRFSVYYEKGEETAGGYLMDHLRSGFLMGPNGEPISLLSQDMNDAAVAAELDKWVK